MTKPAQEALIASLKSHFTSLNGRIYKNWPGPALQEEYPYMVVFFGRDRRRRLQYQYIKELQDGTKLFSQGYSDMQIDLNYLSTEGDEEDQADLVDKMGDFFGINLSDNDYSEISKDIKYNVRGHEAVANVQLLDTVLDQRGEDLKEGDRRSIFTLSMYAPLFTIQTVRTWTDAKVEADIKE